LGTLVTLNGATCYGATCYSGYTWNRTTCELGPLVSGLVVPLGPLMQEILETPGLTVAGNLEHGRVKVVPPRFGQSSLCLRGLTAGTVSNYTVLYLVSWQSFSCNLEG